jgi:hypothetical protein
LAEIYRWIDENGKTQFSDRPVRGKSSSEVTVDTSKNSYGGGDVLNRQRDLLDRYQEQDLQSQKNRQQAAQEKENEKKIKTVCLRAKDKLASFERGLLYTLDDQGERVYYSEEKRTQRIESYRESINKNCK